MNQQPGVPPLVLHGPPDGNAPLPLGRRVTLYVCGITPYDAAHIGHAFTYVAFDTLARFLRGRGHEVAYCQNVTDVDDDVLRRAARDGQDYLELGRRETASYLQDMDALNVARPSFFPKATEEIPAMVELAGQLVEGGNAYVVDGTVFFDVTSYPGFGELSGLRPAEQRDLLAERGGDPDDPRKRHPLDFVVWQRSQPGEPWWDSPWGRGRPGWHLECSAMAREYLGTTIDLHGGGADLLYPHHESERAQSEAANAGAVRPPLAPHRHGPLPGREDVQVARQPGLPPRPRPRPRAGRRPPGPARPPLALPLGVGSGRAQGSRRTPVQLAPGLWTTPSPGVPRRATLPFGGPWKRGLGLRHGRPERWAGARLPEAVEAALAADLDTPAALAATDELAERGDGPGVAAAAAVLGVDLGPANG